MTDSCSMALPAELVIINIGLELFADNLQQQGQQVTHVQWEPPAQGDPELLSMLDDLL
mgnify:CR=1 FL=1